MITTGSQGGRWVLNPHALCTISRDHGVSARDQAFFSTSTFPSANLAIYVPIMIKAAAIIRKLWVATETIGTGTFDLGVFDAGGTKQVSTGSTSKGTTSQEQVVDVTDTFVGPGLYYWAIVASNTTDTYSANTPAAPIAAALGVLTEALGSAVLGSTATWAVNQTLAIIPQGGILLEATPT